MKDEKEETGVVVDQTRTCQDTEEQGPKEKYGSNIDDSECNLGVEFGGTPCYWNS